MSLRLLTRSMMVAVLTSLTVSSCMTVDEEGITENLFRGRPTILGRKLQNPYSVVNMMRAYESLRENNPATDLSAIDVRPTHWYVRFLPPDEISYDRLKNDSSLRLADHPLDYEIVEPGDYYHDPSIPKNSLTYQYATVPVNYRAPEGIAFEVLEELYLPQDDAIIQNAEGRIATAFEPLIEGLEDEALKISGNEEEISGQGARDLSEARRNSKWYPGGSIMVWDNRLSEYIPVAGAKVAARRWFTVHEAYTDASGHFRMKKRFRYPANYRVVWERNGFDIRSGTFGQAVFNGPKMKGDWNLAISRNGISFHYAHVFRAAMRYYYGDIGGLKRPTFRLKYSVFNKQGNHMARNIGNWSVFGINPNILLYRYNSSDGTENDSDEMFSATCHETAHTTHMQTMNGGVIQYSQVSETIRESWAIGVEWFITQKEYKERGISNYGEPTYNVRANYPTLYGFQYWSRKRSQSLTSLFIDVVDRNNQKGQTFGSLRSGTVTDQVAGYTLAGIESGFLKNVYGVGSLGDALKTNRPSEVTDVQISDLLKHF